MKVKLQAGAEFDFLTRGELDTSLADFLKELKGKSRLRRIKADPSNGGNSGVMVAGAATFNTGVGPEPGFVWSIRRLTLSTEGTGGTGGVFLNSTQPSDLVLPSVALPTSWYSISGGAFVVYPGETLWVAVTGVTGNVTGKVWLNGQVEEVAVEHIADLV